MMYKNNMAVSSNNKIQLTHSRQQSELKFNTTHTLIYSVGNVSHYYYRPHIKVQLCSVFGLLNESSEVFVGHEEGVG